MDRTIGLATYPDDTREIVYAVCPRCGEMAQNGYYARDWSFIGCDDCVDKRWAFDVLMEDIDENEVAFPEYEIGVCPVCGQECEWFYLDDYETVGCEHCVHVADATECDEFYQDGI